MVIIQYENDGLLSLGTLAANDAISSSTKIDSARLNGFRIAKVNVLASVEGKTTTEGPIIWGVSCNMNAAQVEDAIEADPQSSPDDDSKGVGQYLKMLGLIGIGTVAESLTGELLGVAQMTPVVMNWSVIEGKQFEVWAYNTGAGALTTGTAIRWAMEIFGVWLRD